MKSIERVCSAISKGKSFLVTTHDCSDGDALGSEVALNLMLRELGKRSHIVNDGPANEKYSFLHGIKSIGTSPGDLRSGYDYVIVVDTCDTDRLMIMDFIRAHRIPIINIDHHQSNTRFGDINWVDPRASSVGEMTYALIKKMGVEVKRQIAVALYTSLITDTGHFTFHNTSVGSHVMAAELLRVGVNVGEITRHIYRSKTVGMLQLESEVIRRIKFTEGGKIAWSRITMDMHKLTGTTPDQIQDPVEIPRSVAGVRVAIIFRETPVAGKIRVSLRSEGDIDVASFAHRFGGGGHPRAAGFTAKGKIAAVEKRVISEIRKEL